MDLSTTIKNIQDNDLQKTAIKQAMEATMKIANNYEKFWIGLFHSQFPEFGQNIHEGGSFEEGIGSLYDIAKADALFRKGYLPYDIAEMLEMEGQRENAAKTVRGWIKRMYPNIFYPNGLDQEGISFRDGRRLIFKDIIDNLVQEGYKTYEELFTALPGFRNKDSNAAGQNVYHELKRITQQTHGGVERLVEKHYPVVEKDYYNRAIKLIRKHGRSYSAYDLAKDLGFMSEYGYTESSLRNNAAKYIRNHIKKSINDLREEAFKLKNFNYYLSSAINLIRKNHRTGIQSGGYGAGKLAVDLGLPNDLGLSAKTVLDRGRKLIQQILKMNYNELVDLALTNRLNS
jgi:hypothetical protein